jgi:hypothetical protein
MKNTTYKCGITENNYENTDAINFKKLFSPKICAISVELGFRDNLRQV